MWLILQCLPECQCKLAQQSFGPLLENKTSAENKDVKKTIDQDIDGGKGGKKTT